MYQALIEEAANGAFRCHCYHPLHRTIEIVSRDPEYDMAHELTKAGWTDGPIQFYRGAAKSTSFRSIARAAGWRIELGEHCPYRLVRRREGQPKIFKNPVAG